jgi:hypothetical protein
MMMGRMTDQQVITISVLLLVACLAVSCDIPDSRAGDTVQQSEAVRLQADGEHLQRVILRITGMS